MIPNPFMGQFAPQDAVPPQPLPFGSDFNAAMRARELQTRMALRSVTDNAYAQNVGQTLSTVGIQGGKALAVTLGSSAARASGAVSQPVESSLAANLGGAASNAVSLAGTAYGTYAANRNATQNLQSLHQAIDSGNLTPQQEQDARQRVLNAGMVSALVGSGTGLLGLGIPGALAGASGGARESLGAFDNWHDTTQGVKNFLSNPFRH